MTRPDAGLTPHNPAVCPGGAQAASPAQDVVLSSADALLVSQVANTQAGELLMKALEILGPEDFATVFGHKPEEEYLVIDPRTLDFTG